MPLIVRRRYVRIVVAWGEKIEFMPHEAERYKERTQVDRTNARLKDEFSAKDIWVRGHDKVKSHLIFGLLALTAG